MSDLKLPPSSPVSEQSIIGAILIDELVLNGVLEILKPEHFYNQTNAQIFTAIKELASRKQAIDVVTLGDYLEKKFATDEHFPYLIQLSKDTPSSKNSISYCETVISHWNGRKIIEACHRATDAIYANSGSYEDTRRGLYDDLEPLFQTNGAELIHGAETLCNDFIEELERLSQNKTGLSGLSTGDYHIDDATGGFHPGDYIGLAARSGGGKTTKALNILGHYTIQGKRSLFFSMEMKRQKVMMKLVSDIGNVPFSAIKKGDLSDDQWHGVSNGIELVKGSKLHVDDSSGLSIDDIERKARQIKAKYGELDLIVIDYIQRLKIDSGKMYQELTSASNRLKDLFMELGCTGIVLAQLKKNSIGVPNASDLRETGAIENDSDALIFLHTPSEDLKPHKGMLTMEIFNKVRFGEAGIKMLRNELDYQRFACSDDEYLEPDDSFR